MRNRLSKPRFVFAYPLAIWLFLVAAPTASSLRLGLLIIVLGEGVRLWANGYVGHVKVNQTERSRNEPKIGQLITAGPYAYVQHPLYLGTLLIGLGFCVIAKNPWLIVGALLFFVLIYPRKAREEEAVLLNEWEDTYRAYQRAVPRWLPTGRRMPTPHGRWNWQGIRASQELKTVLWVIVGSLVFYFREEFGQDHELFGARARLTHTLLAALLIMLVTREVALDLAKRLTRRSSQRAAIAPSGRARA